MGKPGSRLVRKDKFGHVIENITEVTPVPAHQLQLSIDERLQTVTEDALDNAVTWNKAESGAAVLVNIATGEILSMASFPDFNPNNRDGAVLDDFRNRAISDTFEPGSTVKPLVIMTALQQGIVQPDSVIDTHPFTLMDIAFATSDFTRAVVDRNFAEIERYRRVAPFTGYACSKVAGYL